MFFTAFMHVAVRGISTESIAADYADWTLGLGGAPVQRRSRIAEGVLQDWTPERLLASESLVGLGGCRVEMRLNPDRMLMRFIHRDQRDGAVHWHAAARAKRIGDGVLLEHAVGREAPRDYPLDPVASPSRVILSLFDRPNVEVSPRDMLLLPTRLTDPQDARRFVQHVLTRQDRELPILIVSCDRNGKPPLVNPDDLGRKLRGTCAVATLITQDATFEFSNAMADAGFGQMYRCYNGSIHTYGATRSMQEDHRLWLGDRLLEIDPGVRVDRVAGLISRRIAVRDTPQGFFTQIEESDREERRASALKLSEKRSAPPPAPADSVPKEYVALLEKERDELQASLKRSMASEEDSANAYYRADDERQRAERARDQAEAEAEQERAVSQTLREQIAEQKERSTERTVLDDNQRRAVHAILSQRPTPHDCLLLLQVVYPERIVVLDSALTSARKSADFKYADRLMKLLLPLATDYWEAMAAGKGDTVAKGAFGPKSFAANESETTKKNKRAIDERSFMYRQRTLVMWSHLKIGIAETTAETIRIHFAWVAEEKRIVIGWCGEHRYRVG